MKIGEYETHPAADVFPLLEGDNFRALVDDIAQNGLREPIWRVWAPDELAPQTRRPLILDGRNRLRACIEARVTPQFRDYDGNDPFRFVGSLNGHRRHLTDEQRVLGFGRLANLSHGSNQHELKVDGPPGPIHKPLKNDEAAAEAKVSPRTMKRAKVVLKHGGPDLIRSVEEGRVSIKAASNMVLAERANGAPERAAIADDEKPEMVESDAPLSKKQTTTREIDAKVRDAWKSGVTSHAEIARSIDVHASTVGLSLRRQGFVKKLHPIQTIASRAQDHAADLTSYMSQPELYLDGSDDWDREACAKSLRDLQAAVSRAINWLKRNGG